MIVRRSVGQRIVLPALAMLTIALIAGCLSGIPTFIGNSPVPSVHDEFSYLLAGDTFVHYRLTNPPHQLPQYFETLHELMQPTYASKFPPAQGLTLAIGQWFGRPAWGAIGAHALACTALVWMLLASTGLRWACFGGLLAAIHPLLFGWSNSYWGGATTMIGGALLGGAALRLIRRASVGQSVLAGIGAGIIFNARPYEGSVQIALAIGCLAYARFRKTRGQKTIRTVGLAPLYGVLVVLPFVGFDLYYNCRVTGSPWQFPYTLYARQYQIAPLTFFQRPRARNLELPDQLDRYWNHYDLAEYSNQATLNGYFKALAGKAMHIFSEWLNPASLAMPLLGLAMLPWRRWRVVALLAGAQPLIELATTPWLRMQYLAPAAPFLFLLLTLGARQCWRWRVGKILLIGVVSFQLFVFGSVLHATATNTHPAGSARQQLLTQLEQLPGRQLVIVRYLPGKQLMFEWVFNSADIDAQRVVFARERGPATMHDLQQYFPDRAVWLLEVQENEYKLSRIADPIAPSDRISGVRSRAATSAAG